MNFPGFQNRIEASPSDLASRRLGSDRRRPALLKSWPPLRELSPPPCQLVASAAPLHRLHQPRQPAVLQSQTGKSCHSGKSDTESAKIKEETDQQLNCCETKACTFKQSITDTGHMFRFPAPCRVFTYWYHSPPCRSNLEDDLASSSHLRQANNSKRTCTSSLLCTGGFL